MLFQLRALTLCVSICWYFSLLPTANLSNAVFSEECECEFKELAKGSGVYLIFSSLNVTERWVRSAETWGDSSPALPQLSGELLGLGARALHGLIGPTESGIETWSTMAAP